MSDDLDLLITRYLEGTATPEEVARLDRLIVSDPSVREAVLQAARQAGDVREILTKLDGKSVPSPVVRRRFPVVPLIAAAAFLALLAGVLFYSRVPTPPPVVTPAAPKVVDDLQGWQIRSGKWTLQDGVLTGEIVKEGQAARIESVATYGDFELTCRVRLTGATTAEVQVRSYSWYVALTWQVLRDWTDVKVVARGKDLQATVNGNPYTLTRGHGVEESLTGSVSFYCSPRAKKMEIRDVVITPLGPR